MLSAPSTQLSSGFLGSAISVGVGTRSLVAVSTGVGVDDKASSTAGASSSGVAVVDGLGLVLSTGDDELVSSTGGLVWTTAPLVHAESKEIVRNMDIKPSLLI